MTLTGSICDLQTSPLSEWGTSRCVVSHLTYLEKEDTASPLSLKMVLEGVENYRVNGTSYKLCKDQVLLVDQGEQVETRINSDQNTTGICIYPPMQLMKAAYANHLTRPEDRIEQKQVSTKLPTLTSGVFSLRTSGRLPDYLRSTLPALLTNDDRNSDWWLNFYLGLAEQLVAHQVEVDDRLAQIQSVKKHTKEELYRRISLARDFIHDNWCESINLDALAKVSMLSKYHFLRSFKSVFKMTPYQYLLQLKLSRASRLIREGYSYNDAAMEVGYSDGKNLRKSLKVLANN